MLKAVLTLLSAAFVCTSATAAPSYHVEVSIAGPDGGWDLASVDPGAHRLYVARSNSVTAVDLVTARAQPILSAERGHAALAIPGGPVVFVTNGTTNTAVLFDGRTERCSPGLRQAPSPTRPPMIPQPEPSGS